MKCKTQLFIVTSLALLLTSYSANVASDPCTDALNKAITNWDRSIQTYDLKAIKKTFMAMSEKWKQQLRDGVPPSEILLKTPQLQNQVELRDLRCISTK